MNNEKRIYTIGTAHLDTVWNWDFEYVIDTCLKNTLNDNFALFEKYPDYKFNFEGSYRYELMEEYYPEKFEQLKKYVDEGRWNVCGSCYENGDVNVPSPESLFRNILYGNRYFYKTFGKKSNDIFLPDCFGFGWALPSIAQHANLKGFSTQKLSWGSAYGCPFDVGIWTGVNGKSIFASIDPKSYCTKFRDVRKNIGLTKKLNNNISKYSLPWTMGYHGVGDVGGAPKEASVKTVCDEIAANETNDIKVLSASTTQFFDDLSERSPEETARLPRWNNELVMTNHGVGSYTSRAFSKRYNRKNEELADMAERNSVIASNVCSLAYPSKTLETAWKRTIAHTFHDDITGTSVQRVYQRSWNDYILSANQLSSCYEAACGEVIKNMDTSWTKGIAVAVNNSLERDRMSVVDISVPNVGYKYVRVFDENGREVPSQVNSFDENYLYVSFCANVRALGYRIYDVLYSYEPCKMNTGLRATNNILENYKYIVTINKNGDISSVFDKTLDKEILSKPIRFELNKYIGDKEYPAWEHTYKEVMKYPWEFADKGRVTLVENGPARVTIKVEQTCNKSTFTYYVSLAAGCQWVSVYNEIEWREFKRILHNGFCFNVRNDKAIFDLGLGAIARGKANKKLYSVPAQKWVDLTDASQEMGVSVFSDSKYGWIMKDEQTLRMTILHSPKNFFRHDSVQGMMEFGLNKYGYAIYSHKGNYTNETQFFARCFNQPMAAFITNRHQGVLGSDYSFIEINNKNVIIRAIKKAEDSDEIIVRVNEGSFGHVNNATIKLGKGIVSARELYASEEDLGPATVQDGKLVFSLTPYEVKTFAVTLEPCKVTGTTVQNEVELPLNADILTYNSDRGATSIHAIDVSIPAEIYPSEIECSGISFKTSDVRGGNNALICNGQTVKVSANKLYFVAASLYGDKVYNFKAGENEVPVRVQAIEEKIGGWDLYDLAETAFIKTDRLAWECTHTHGPDKDNVAAQLFFFMYEINTENVNEITLPDDNGLLILAATEVYENNVVRLNTPLYDRISKRPFDYKMSRREKKAVKKLKKKSKKPHNKS